MYLWLQCVLLKGHSEVILECISSAKNWKENEGAMNEQGRRSGRVGVGYSPQNILF